MKDSIRRIKLTTSPSDKKDDGLFEQSDDYNRRQIEKKDEKLNNIKGRPKKNMDDRKIRRVHTYLTQRDKEDYYRYCNEYLRIDVAADLRSYILKTLDKARSEGRIK